MSRLNFYKAGWSIDEQALRLISPEGAEAVIGERALDVLTLLSAARGAVVTKEQLMEAVWGDVAVTQNSLNQAIRELRRVLGDEADHPRFIETIRGKGYRLVAAPQIENNAVRAEGNPPLRLRAHVLAAGAVFMLMIAVVGALWFVLQPHREIAVVSPDGVFRAVVEARRDSAHLQIIHIASDMQHLEYDFPMPQSLVLVWSPDATRVAVNATRREDDDLVVSILSLEGEKPNTFRVTRDPLIDPALGSGTDNTAQPQTSPAYTLALGTEQLIISTYRDKVDEIRWPADNM